jgi:hypothetical protein
MNRIIPTISDSSNTSWNFKNILKVAAIAGLLLTVGGIAIPLIQGANALTPQQNSLVKWKNPVDWPCSTIATAPASHDDRFSGNVQKPINADVVHLAQIHWSQDAEKDPIMLKSIWESQKAIAEYLLSNPDAAVFAEGYSHTLKTPPYGPNDFTIPQKLDSLPSDLRKFFIQGGAVETLYNLGKIGIIHRSITPKNEAKIFEAIQQEKLKETFDCDEHDSLIYEQREQALIKEVRSFLKHPENRNRKIVIIFGAKHDFSKYFNPKKYLCINTAIASQQKLVRQEIKILLKGLEKIALAIKDSRKHGIHQELPEADRKCFLKTSASIKRTLLSLDMMEELETLKTALSNYDFLQS